MHVLQNISLKPYNTFGIDMPAEYFMELTNEEWIPIITSDTSLPQHRSILGGGSNILLTKPVTGLLLQNKLKGIELVKEDADNVWLKAASGEVWHDLVMYAIHKGWGGIENLALIPGTVGASPMQNIGAYGVEAKETIKSVTAWHWEEKQFITYSKSECNFGYRDSIFKHDLKDKVFITSVTFKLSKKPTYNISYGAIAQELEKMGVQELNIKSIADAVIAIRSSKLPDPKEIGNAGSFFKNPTISTEQFLQLQTGHPAIPSYPVSDVLVKVPAGWLIEQCGWKGYRKEDIGVHAKQALVLVNYGNGNGGDIWNLSGEIVDSVQNKFGIELEREVQVW
jgi:UDP-N-acetylmuramate dehydrogenase